MEGGVPLLNEIRIPLRDHAYFGAIEGGADATGSDVALEVVVEYLTSALALLIADYGAEAVVGALLVA